MDRDINCLVTRSLINHVEEQVGRSSELLHGLHPYLEGVEDPKSFLTDDHNWISASLMKELFRRAKQLTLDDSVAMKAGFEAVRKRRLGYVQELFLRTMTTPAAGLKHAQSINEKFNRTKKVELIRMARNEATMRLHWFEDLDLTRDFCLINQGIYKAIATVWRLPPAELIETECYFEGGRYCEYHLKWKPGSRRLFIKSLLSGLFPAQRHFRHAMEELEKERNLLEQKFAESYLLTIKLNEKIERLAAIQEATRMVISMADLKEVLGGVMNLMVKVTGFQRAALMLVDEEKGVLKFGQGVGADEDLISKFHGYEVSLDRMNNVMVRVARSGIPVFIEDVKLSNLNPDNPILKQFKPTSFFVVPVTVREKVIGVMAADKGFTQTDITEDDRDYLIAFVNQIGGAIENSRLIDAMLRDQEERERLQKLLVRADKLSSIGRMAADIVHDVKNPLNIISLWTQTLNEELHHQEHREALDSINMQVDRASSILDKLRRLSRQEMISMAPLDIAGLVDSVLSTLEPVLKNAGIQVEMQIESTGPDVAANREQIEHVLVNLCMNARDAMPQGGLLSVSAGPAEEGYYIRMVDTGYGIPEADLSKIFEPFYTTKPADKGTGIGLSIVASIIHEHGGSIDVESRLGTGTAFTIKLPTLSEEAREFEKEMETLIEWEREAALYLDRLAGRVDHRGFESFIGRVIEARKRNIRSIQEHVETIRGGGWSSLPPKMGISAEIMVPLRYDIESGGMETIIETVVNLETSPANTARYKLLDHAGAEQDMSELVDEHLVWVKDRVKEFTQREDLIRRVTGYIDSLKGADTPG